MVSIMEFENFGFFPFSNWPDFRQKWSKIGPFEPQMAQNQGFSNFLPNYVLIKVISILLNINVSGFSG